MAVEGLVQEADALNDTPWTTVDAALDAYGTAVQYWPKSTPINVAIRGLPVTWGRGIPAPPPPNLEGMLQPRSQPEEITLPAPPPEEEVRKTVEGVTGNQTNTTSTPESTSRSNTTSDNETLAEQSPSSPESGVTQQVDAGSDPEVELPARPLATEDPLAPLGLAASEVNRVPAPRVVVFVAAGLALAAAVTWLASQTRFLGRLLAGIPGVALFSRQTGREVLQSPVRAQIYAVVAHEPGITFTKLRQVMELATSTLRYHLAILRRENLIRVTRRSRILHYHDAGVRADGQAQAREYLFGRGRSSLASAILRHPGANQQAVSRLAGLPASRVSVYTRELAEAGLVRSERVGRYRTYYPTTKLEKMRASGQVPTSS